MSVLSGALTDACADVRRGAQKSDVCTGKEDEEILLAVQNRARAPRAACVRHVVRR